MRITTAQCAMLDRMLSTPRNEWTRPETELAGMVLTMAGREAAIYKDRVEHPVVPVAASDPL